MNRSADDIRGEYAETGFVVFRNVLDAALIADASRHVDWLLERHPELRADELGHELARDDPFWYRLVSDPRLVDIAEIFIGPDVALFATHYICKEPGVGRAVPWHQDGGYWPLEPMEVVSLWLAVSDSTPRQRMSEARPWITHHSPDGHGANQSR